MVEVTENKQLLERKQFLMRGLSCHNITEEEYNAEIPELDRQIKENLIKVLIEQEDNLQGQIIESKKHSIYDGDLKRKIASLLYNILRDNLSDDEVKGIFRTGYKICRGK